MAAPVTDIFIYSDLCKCFNKLFILITHAMALVLFFFSNLQYRTYSCLSSHSTSDGIETFSCIYSHPLMGDNFYDYLFAFFVKWASVFTTGGKKDFSLSGRFFHSRFSPIFLGLFLLLNDQLLVNFYRLITKLMVQICILMHE